MTFIADLHIHSRFSRATSKELTLPILARGARTKGIDVLGTGDFTHPQWREEMRDRLVLDEASGLYRLGADADPEIAGPSPLFCLQAEISSIYKRHGKVRKVHSLVYAPTLDDARRISARLGRIGNLNADGRPILGLDCRDLLEIVLECSPKAVLVPAHIWTPWFSLFGSKSGFDALEDCFGDLSAHIFALETGLSSDPDMNRRISALDGYALISNSDAHSAGNLGREANLFSGTPSFDGMFDALRAAAARRPTAGAPCGFLGTLEFCPEEGKYHLDGHRACNVALEPQEAAALKNICPVCGKPLTIGVLHRVLELADRAAAPDNLPHEPPARPVIPLVELISEILNLGRQSRKVQERHEQLVRTLGPELHILSLLPETDIRSHWDVLGEAVSRMRRGDIIRKGGYDGEYGSARVFAPGELRRAHSGPSFFIPPETPAPAGVSGKKHPTKPDLTKIKNPSLFDAPSPSKQPKTGVNAASGHRTRLTEEQNAALTAQPGPILVLAGPGAGKTGILVGRLQWLLEQGEDARRIIAVTFTRRAAREMHERLAAALPRHPALPRCDTLHSLAFSMLRRENPQIALLSEDEAFALFCEANASLPRRGLRVLWREIAAAAEKGSAVPPGPEAQRCAELYRQRKAAKGDLHDYQDLLDFLKKHLRAPDGPERPIHLLVDEVQDLSPMQLDLVRDMAGPDGQGFFAIGDPDQAIYGFRGAATHCRDDLRAFWPHLRIFQLGKSFRSGQGVLTLAQTLLQGRGRCGQLTAATEMPCRLDYFTAPNEKAEAAIIADRIEKLLGATSHTLLDRFSPDLPEEQFSPGSIAVLTRLKSQMPLLREALERKGIPCVAPALEEKNAQAELSDEVGPDWLREAERAELRAERVQILTLHAAKGLEFEAVFLPGMEDGILPLRRATLFNETLKDAARDNAPETEDDARADGCDEEEERRLLYVGLTRAARRVFLIRAESRRIYGRLLKLPPSPFLEDIKRLCREGAIVPRRHHLTKKLSLFS